MNKNELEYLDSISTNMYECLLNINKFNDQALDELSDIHVFRLKEHLNNLSNWLNKNQKFIIELNILLGKLDGYIETSTKLVSN